MSHYGSDPATWTDASEEVDFAAACDSMDDRFKEIISESWPGGKPTKGAIAAVLGMVHKCLALTDDGGSRGDHEVVARILGIITRPQSNPGMMAECMRFVFNLSPRSQTAIADEYGVTRAAISRVCVKLSEDFGIAPGRGMKSEQAREAYAERATLVHAQKPPAEEEPEDGAWGDVIDAVFDIPAASDENFDQHKAA